LAKSGEAISVAKATPTRITFTGASPCYPGGHAASNNKTEIELSVFPEFLAVFNYQKRVGGVLSAHA
jgi:hypothetical protein